MKKVFYLFAGVNGAGKSTLYNSESLNNDIKILLELILIKIIRYFLRLKMLVGLKKP